MKVNWNDIAREIAALEGGKVNLSIAQVKEVLRCFRIVIWKRFRHAPSAWLGFCLDLARRCSRDISR